LKDSSPYLVNLIESFEDVWVWICSLIIFLGWHEIFCDGIMRKFKCWPFYRKSKKI
jgi:hypothetical protein